MKRAIACIAGLFASTVIALGQQSGGCVYAGLGGGVPSLASALKNSTAIVYGDAMVPNRDENIEFPLRVIEVWKGSLKAGSMVKVSGEQHTGCWGPDYKFEGIWFLNGQAVLPARLSVVRPLPGQWVYPSYAAVEDKLLRELAASLEKDPPKSEVFPDPRVHYLEELENQIPTGAQTTDRVSGGGVFDQMIHSSSNTLQSAGLAALIRRGQYAALEQAVKNSPQYIADWDVISSIKGYYRSADPKSVALLGSLAADPGADPSFREAAVYALQGMHTKATIPYLVKLFDDPDLGAWAISGIELYAMGSPMQTAESTASQDHMWYSGHPSQEMFANFELGPGAVKHKEYWRKWLTDHRLAN